MKSAALKICDDNFNHASVQEQEADALLSQIFLAVRESALEDSVAYLDSCLVIEGCE